MLLRILTLATVLFATQTVSAEETPASSHPSSQHQPNVCPAPEPPHPSSDTSRTAVSDRTSRDATRDEQQLLLQRKCAELDRLQREVRQLRAATGTPQQILVKVQVLEVALTKLREMGIDIDWFANGYVRGAAIRQFLDTTAGPASTPTAELRAKKELNGSLRFVEGLKQNNLAKVLADPTVVVVSGRPVSVHLGGEFPVPANNDSKAAVDFRKYGTELDLQAVALGDNQVRLELKMSVSAIDDNHEIEINGARVPGLRVRQFDTASELSFGQTAVTTGLVVQRTEAYMVDGGRIEERLVDVGLILVVTPELVHPFEVPAASADRDTDRAIRK